jgi:type I restriction enzyme S subunit
MRMDWMRSLRMSDWQEISYKDAVELNPPVRLTKGNIYPFVEMKAVDPAWREVSYSEMREFKSGGAKFKPMDTLLARITPCLENGKIARYVPIEAVGPSFGSTEFIIVRGREGVTDNDFAYYLTIWPEFREFAISQMTGSSGRQRVPVDSLAGFNFNLPPIPEQKAIAHILGSLDDKIELNRRMNKTLEAMAQALFKSWFVDFDPVIDNALAAGNEIPDELKERAEIREALGDERRTLPDEIRKRFPDEFEHTEELGWIPKGWKVISVEEIAQKVAMGPFGSSIKVSTFVTSGIPIISGKHLNHTRVEDIEYNYITNEHADKLKNANVYKGDLIFTHAGNIGQVAYIPESSEYDRYVLSQRQFYLRCDESKVSPQFMIYFFRSPEGQHKILANTSSTGVPSISRPVTYLKTIKFTKPSVELVRCFSQYITDYHGRMGSIDWEIKSLTELRETLLPKLLSGNLRVDDFAQVFEEML